MVALVHSDDPIRACWILDAGAARNERGTKSACRIFLFAFHQKFIKDHEFSSENNEKLLISIKK